MPSRISRLQRIFQSARSALQRPFQGWRVFEYFRREAPTNFRSTSTSGCAAKVQHGDHDSPLLAA